jgi:hypothetical protein
MKRPDPGAFPDQSGGRDSRTRRGTPGRVKMTRSPGPTALLQRFLSLGREISPIPATRSTYFRVLTRLIEAEPRRITEYGDAVALIEELHQAGFCSLDERNRLHSGVR